MLVAQRDERVLERLEEEDEVDGVVEASKGQGLAGRRDVHDEVVVVRMGGRHG